MKYNYICRFCNKQFNLGKELHPLLQICQNCRDDNKDEVNKSILEVNRLKREEQKKYWEDHPEEYKEFLRKRKEKRDATKIAKYGSLENAERARIEKQLSNLKEIYPDEDWDNITNVAQLTSVKKKISDSLNNKDKQDWISRQEKTNNTKINKYGSLEEANRVMIENLKATSLERYGFDYYNKTEESKEKYREIFRNKTKEDWNKIVEKSRETRIRNSGSIEESYRLGNLTSKKSCLEKYGVDSYNKTDKARQNLKKVFASKTDEDWAEVYEKTKATKIEKYGSLESAQEHARLIREETCMKIYNAPSPLESPEIQQKCRNTLVERYGVNNASKIEGNKEKVNNTIIERYGSWRNTKTDEQRERRRKEILQENLSKYRNVDFNLLGFDYFEEEEAPYVVCSSCKTKYVLTTPPSHIRNLRCEKCNPFTTSSLTESYIRNTISSWGIKVVSNDRSILEGKELDIYIPDYNLAIEYDGCYWHRYKEFCEDTSQKNSHLEKTLKCEEKGIQLIHIFDEEFQNNEDLVFDLLKKKLNLVSNKIGARKCEIREIDNETYRNFVNENHFQKYSPASVKVGLYYNNELLACMSFVKSRYNSSYEWELSRYCEKKDYVVLGGKDKLLKWFEKKYSPKSIISYCDRRWFTGTSYIKMGFDLDHTSKPNYKYFKNGYFDFYSRINFQKHKLKNIEGFDYREELTEMENMWNNGYSVIFDCGNLVFVKNYKE